MKIEIDSTGHVPIARIMIDPAAIDAWLATADEDTRANCGFPDDDEMRDGFMLDQLTSCDDDVRGQIAAFGLLVLPDQTIMITTYADDMLRWIKHQFEGIFAVTDLVHKSYEHTAPDQSGWGPMLPNLWGDDDVDYSGSYIDCAATAILAYLDAHAEQLS